MIISSVLYLAIVLSLIWGRLRFFKMNTGTPRLSAMLYDATVTIQIVVTLYLMLTSGLRAAPILYLCSFMYLLSLLLFWWAIFTAKTLDFAFSDQVGNIVTTGPFRLVRHPFYTSYILAWLSSSLLFNSMILWITLLYLVAFYFLSARKEEQIISKSVYSTEYGKYIQDVGMFLPRIKNGRNDLQSTGNRNRD